MIEIPQQALSADAVQGVLEEFVNREGTDYGDIEFSLQQKTQRLKKQWERGDILLVFDPETESTTFISKYDWQQVSQSID